MKQNQSKHTPGPCGHGDFWQQACGACLTEALETVRALLGPVESFYMTQDGRSAHTRNAQAAVERARALLARVDGGGK